LTELLCLVVTAELLRFKLSSYLKVLLKTVCGCC